MSIRDCFEQLKKTVDEARAVSEELEGIMEKSVVVSEHIVDSIDKKMAEFENAGGAAAHNSKASVKKIRIYELAQELGISSSSLVSALKESGYGISNHMNTLDEETAAFIKRQMSEIKRNVNEDHQEEEMEKLKTAHPYLAVRTLHARGYTVKQIAQMLDRGQGEINLILNLAEKKRQMYL
ncbi:MAG: translation initiation factor IF-2 N-terminal domain-containing protein [Syntrophomonadaceae bacterium]|nr:translation initiation factor IF-2 N-terminal domain-containing protein [Syntrophomonadaceae bacterium]